MKFSHMAAAAKRLSSSRHKAKGSIRPHELSQQIAAKPLKV